MIGQGQRILSECFIAQVNSLINNWLFTDNIRTDVSNNAYGYDQFIDKIWNQFLGDSEKEREELPQETQDKVDEGVNDFWESFALVGVEAKVFKANDDEEKK